MKYPDNITPYRHQFIEEGYTLIDNQVPNPVKWRGQILNSIDLKEVYVPENKRKVAAGKGSLKYAALDRFQLDKVIKEIHTYYHSLVELLTLVTNQNIITSPYDRSAYYAKVYKSKGDEQGWHYDTNGLTVILYLTDNTLSGRTEIERLNDKKRVFVNPKAGSMLVMKGRECWHRAEPIESGLKVICPLNYYVDVAEERDPRIDDIIFGNV